MILHEDKDVFITYVSSVSQSLGLPEVYIEKDYWVTRSLKQLSESDMSNDIVFKGGTSLSKAHNLIHRFSEDIDLAAIADGLGDAKRKRLLKDIEAVACKGLDLLPDDKRNSKGSKFRKTVYRYPRFSDEDDFGQASPELLLEVNTFTNPEPCERKVIQSMIADMLLSADRQDLIEQYELGSFELNVLSVHRTLIEKLLGIIKDSYFEDPIVRLTIRIRHVYDICMILREPANRNFVSSDDFNGLCQSCIADEIESWGEEQAAYLKGGLYAAPLFNKFDKWWPALESTYTNDFADLVYGDLPDVAEIKDTLSFLHKELMKIK
ncbi:MAG: nucleotidyl transferase AbiEii/AbiGii toxin family protein [Gammaproteobacteria bacterium]|nr:nucleotidyl transferase AbiEii/AbiGii toxin family protein [Gammaproteobacteria bacterium]